MGEVVGQYELKEVLGGGGMATVYRGVHVSGIGMQAAVKKLHPHLAIDSKLRKRLRVEAQALVRLHHPNIVRILDFVEENESCALIVELVDGRTLRAVMNDYDDAPMPIALALLLFRQVLVALAHAHKHDCLHRDIKPGNIMVDADNRVKVLDFGIASLVDQERLTQTGMSIGTPVYMAPEAILDGMESLDARADVYALGVTFWEVLAGKGARPIGQRGWRLEPEMVDDLAGKGVPQAVIDVLRSMIALDVEERLASCEAVMRALNWAMEESKSESVSGVRAPLPAGPPGEPSRPDAEDPGPTEDFPGTVPYRSSPISSGELPTEAIPGGFGRVAELTRGERAPKAAGAGKEQTLAPKKKKKKRKKAPKARSKAPWIAAAVAVPGVGALLWFALAGPTLGTASGDPETLAALQQLPGMIAFDRSAFFYGPEDRKVVLSAFAVERTEVTVEAYGRCVAAGVCPDRTSEYVGYTPSGASPMEHVDWLQAATYCEWRYRNTAVPEGYGSRLPTDAEWERTARGTGRPGRAFPLGDALPGDLPSAGTARAPAAGPTPVATPPAGGAARPAAVCEWGLDEGPEGVDEEEVWSGYPSDGGVDPVAAPAARTKGTRGVRGSGYLQHPSMDRYFRSTARVWMTGTRSGPGRGFRCVVGPQVTP